MAVMSYPNRLTALRTALTSCNVDGFLLPREDEHLNEYAPPSAERLAWLSGFTGSAGLTLILPHVAAVFSDGRYQVQMEQQLDPTLWARLHIYDTPPAEWLTTEGRGLRIGYDPKITSMDLLAPYLTASCEMVPLASNPIDAIWHDRPAAPATPLITQPLEWAGQHHNDKIRMIADDLRSKSLDATVIIDPTCIAWLLNIRADDLPYLPVALSFVILQAGGTAAFFIDSSRVDAPVRAHLGENVTLHAPETLQKVLETYTDKRVLLDFKKSPVWFQQVLKDAGASVVAGTDPCLMPRARKTEAEREGMRRAHLLDGIALTRFLYWLDQEGCGKTELEASAKLLWFRKQHPDCHGASFNSIAAAGPNAAIMHYGPTPESDRVIEADSFFLIDSGGQYTCGTTDVTRTIWMGQNTPSPTFCDHYTRVLKGLIALDQAVFPSGSMGYRLDPLARHALWAVGLDFDHGAGHGLGSFLSVHEWPLGFTRRPVLDPIYEGMILTNEPGFYTPGSHGIRLENAMETCKAPNSADGSFLCFQHLTRAPIDRSAFDLSLLTPPERAWINAYHAIVEREITPHLNAAEASWLKTVCRPL